MRAADPLTFRERCRDAGRAAWASMAPAAWRRAAPIGRRRWLVAWTLAALAWLPTAASDSAASAVLGLEASGGYGSYVMNDADQSLSSLDLAIGGHFGTLDGGASFGVFGRAWTGESLLMRFGIEKLRARAEDLGVGYDLSAWEFSLTGTWFLPSRSFARFGFGGGLGVYETAGKIEATGVDMKASGIAPGIQGGVEVEAPLVSGWSACAVAGGRYAKVQTLKFGTRDTNHAADYSGMFVRFAVARDWK